MKKIIFGVVFILALLVIAAKVVGILPDALGIKEKAGIRVSSTPEGANVLIDNIIVGKTPFESDNLTSGEVSVKIESSQGSWEGKVKLRGQTITFINRDLGDSSAGEILTLEKGKGITVISNPGGSNVLVDGEMVGQTPGSFSTPSGEHTFVVSHEGFLNRSIKASIPENYNLTLTVDLVASESVPVASSSPAPSVTSSVDTVTVLNTPVGFLRVRDKPSTAGKEIGRVDPGDELEIVEEVTSWTKIKMPGGDEGYVSNQYIKKNSNT